MEKRKIKGRLQGGKVYFKDGKISLDVVLEDIEGYRPIRHLDEDGNVLFEEDGTQICKLSPDLFRALVDKMGTDALNSHMGEYVTLTSNSHLGEFDEMMFHIEGEGKPSSQEGEISPTIRDLLDRLNTLEKVALEYGSDFNDIQSRLFALEEKQPEEICDDEKTKEILHASYIDACYLAMPNHEDDNTSEDETFIGFLVQLALFNDISLEWIVDRPDRIYEWWDNFKGNCVAYHKLPDNLTEDLIKAGLTEDSIQQVPVGDLWSLYKASTNLSKLNGVWNEQ